MTIIRRHKNLVSLLDSQFISQTHPVSQTIYFKINTRSCANDLKIARIPADWLPVPFLFWRMGVCFSVRRTSIQSFSVVHSVPPNKSYGSSPSVFYMVYTSLFTEHPTIPLYTTCTAERVIKSSKVSKYNANTMP